MTRLIVTIGFVCAFAAGFALDLGWSQHAPRPADQPQRGDRGSWLAEQLNLTPEQQAQMKDIWADTARRGNRQQWEQRRKLREERDAAIASLIREEDRAAYEQIIEEYKRKADALEAQWRQSFDQAVEQTRALLTDEQRAKYEQILERQRRDNRDERRRGPDRSNHSDQKSEQ